MTSTTFTNTISEINSSAHRQFRGAHEGHKPHAGLDATRASTGVVWTSEQAYKHGFLENPDEWANLGQGAPEVDDSIEGCFERPKEIDISAHGREYGPTAGIRPLREAVAKLYNEHHRKWRKSLYTWENVCIVPGGRAGLIRIAAVLGNTYLGFFIPGEFVYCPCCLRQNTTSMLQGQIVFLESFEHS
jgi:hypothetical protein